MAVIHIIVLLAAVVLALLIYRYDMYDREPWFLIVTAIALGALSAWWCMNVAEDKLILKYDAFESHHKQAMIAAGCEEACKLGIVVLFATVFRRWFNDPMDGIVYGAFAGLGFGIAESVFYLDLALRASPHPTRMQLFGQEANRLLFHFLTGSLSGFGVGLVWAKIQKTTIKIPQAPLMLVGSLGLAVLIHYLWDFHCGLSADPHSASQRFIAVGLMLFALALFGVAVVVGNLWSALAHPPDGDVPPLVRWPFTLLLRNRSRRE